MVDGGVEMGPPPIYQGEQNWLMWPTHTRFGESLPVGSNPTLGTINFLYLL